MVVHELYELFLVHSYDYEPVVHDNSIFIFTGSWKSSNSYSWVHGKVRIHIHGFMEKFEFIFMGSYDFHEYIHGFPTSYSQVHRI